MYTCSPIRIALHATLFCVLPTLFCSPVVAQLDRQQYLDKKPLAEVAVQSLSSPSDETYADPNLRMMYQTEAEDPLSFYARTQDGEWQIPLLVNREDPWVRLLLLGPVKPTIVDVAIEIDQHSFRAAREEWIDKLLVEAKAAFLVRTGVAATEADEGKSDEQEDEQETDTEETSPAEEVPMVAAQSRPTSTLFKRLINYLTADQSTAEREASREELRWLLAEWTGGPALLTLSPAFAWRRAEVAPLWRALDRDGNKTLSREEIERTTTTFQQADINRDDIVDLEELKRLDKGHAPHGRTNGHPLVLVLDENTDEKALHKHWESAYGPQSEFTNLLSSPADVVVRVSFANEDAKVALLATSDGRDDGWQFHSSTKNVMTVERRETYLEISAAQGEIDSKNASGDMQQTQVAIGAVVDGHPLFRLLDHDNNRQLTQRERRNAKAVLTSLDRNKDGQVDRSEMPTAIRLAVTHGPQVHEHLSHAVAAQREEGVQVDSAIPAWFAGMDRNHDGDLSKREFQGSPAQFTKFDRDSDGLISREEVQ